MKNNQALDLVGQKFDMLTVVRLDGRRHNVRSWLCRCECGNETRASSGHLRSGHTGSCGCRRLGAKNHGRGGGSNGYRNQLAPGRSARNKLLNTYQNAARQRGYEWALTGDQFDELIDAHCCYCGAPPGRLLKVGSNGELLYNGIDRVDNIEGYTQQNSVTACRICNLAKHTMRHDDFVDWVRRVYHHLNANTMDALLSNGQVSS